MIANVTFPNNASSLYQCNVFLSNYTQTHPIDSFYFLNFEVTNINNLIKYFNFANAVLFLVIPLMIILFGLILTIITKDYKVGIASLLNYIFLSYYLSIFNSAYGPFLNYLHFPLNQIYDIYYIIFAIQLIYTIYLILKSDFISNLLKNFKNK